MGKLSLGKTYYAAEDPRVMEPVLGAAQEDNREEGSEQDFCTAHHLVDRGGHREEPNIHQNCCREVEKGWDCQHQDLFPHGKTWEILSLKTSKGTQY